jgi:predicted nucleic acid-binding Zn ribbon protein
VANGGHEEKREICRREKRRVRYKGMMSYKHSFIVVLLFLLV